jgi:LysR family transcriptional regulator, glycine cleavage system transcriptional activator
LASFHARYPNIDLHIIPVSGVANFDDAGDFDVALEFGRDDSVFSVEVELVNEFLLPNESYPVISPILLQQTPVRALTDLANHALIHVAQTPNELAKWVERIAKKTNDKEALEQLSQGIYHRGPMLDSASATLSVVRDGYGITLGSHALTFNYILSEQLSRPLPYIYTSSTSYRLVYPRTFKRRRNVRSFLNWIREEAKKYRSPNDNDHTPAI